SNETGYQHVIPELARITRPASVYLGVGPEQNFTYIVALKPQLAIVFDIRRQNMVELLMYKALFELSETRTDFLSRLFSRPARKADDSVSARRIFEALEPAEPDSAMFRRTLAAMTERLQKVHGLELTA